MSGAFSTSAGLRLDRHSHYGSSLNPRLGAVYKPREQHVQAQYGEVFRAPSPEETLSAYGTFSGAQDAQGNYIGSNFRIPNFNLQPEKARAAWDWRPTPSLNLVTHPTTAASAAWWSRSPGNVGAIPGARC